MLALACKWDKAVREDKLQPVLPVSFEDSPEEGARAAITHTKATLVTRLLDDSQDLALAGKAHEAAQEALLATRISESLKYSDFNSVYLSSVEEQRATFIISKVVPQLNAVDKAVVRDGVAAIQANGQELATLTRFSRTQYYDWLSRMSKAPVSIEDIHRTVLVTKRVESDPTSKDTLSYVRSSLMQDPMDGGPEYLSELRLAWAAEDAIQAHLKKLLASL